MLKKRDLNECVELFELMVDPSVFPYVRDKAYSSDEYIFLTKKLIELEEQNQAISRTILNEMGKPIGVISLFDISNGEGFLGTWLGRPYHGKGYNQLAKEQFFEELFYTFDVKTIFMKVRKTNLRSKKAVEKLPFVQFVNDFRMDIYSQINANEEIYDLYAICKEEYSLQKESEVLKEA